MLRAAIATALLVGLAGCATGPADEVPQANTLPPTPPAAPAPPPVLRTDTLHLLDPPHMAGTLPAAGQAIRTYVPSDVDDLRGPVTVPAWSLPRPAFADLAVDVHLTIDVEGVVTNPPRGAFNCFWTLELAVVHADGTLAESTSICHGAPDVLPDGVQALDVPLSTTFAGMLQPGDRLAFSLQTMGVYTPGAAVDVLSGTADGDSTLTIHGLQLPVDTQTLP